MDQDRQSAGRHISGRGPSQGSASPPALEGVPKFRRWRQNLADAGCRVRSVKPLSLLRRSDGRLLFALVDLDAEDGEGRKLARYALIRGHACVVVPVVEDGKSGERRFLMIRQRRVAHGRMSLEFPAGMLDERVDDPVGVGVEEVREETGLSIRREDLVPLCERPLYSSPGLSDEGVYFYACHLVLGPDQLRDIQGRVAGLKHEGEHIEVGLWHYRDALPEIDSQQTRLGFQLYFDLEHARSAARG